MRQTWPAEESLSLDQPKTTREESGELFKGLGCLPGMYHIQLIDGATPVVHAPRKVPVPQREKVIEELKRMEKLGVIVRQENPTEWVNSLVVVQKPNGAVRLCIDPRDLNAAMKRSHYPMKTVDEVATRLQGANTFSILDAKSGFWQLKLDRAFTSLYLQHPNWSIQVHKTTLWCEMRPRNLPKDHGPNGRRPGWC